MIGKPRRRVLAEGAAVAAFFAVMLLGVPLMHAASTLYFMLAEPPYRFIEDRFFVAVVDTTQTDARRFGHVTLKELAAPPVRPERRRFLLPERAGQIPGEHNALAFEVLEDHADWQRIEVRYTGTYDAWSRYIATRDGITPLSYRSAEMAWVMIPLVCLLPIAYFASRLTRRLALRWIDPSVNT